MDLKFHWSDDLGRLKLALLRLVRTGLNPLLDAKLTNAYAAKEDDWYPAWLRRREKRSENRRNKLRPPNQPRDRTLDDPYWLFNIMLDMWPELRHEIPTLLDDDRDAVARLLKKARNGFVHFDDRDAQRNPEDAIETVIPDFEQLVQLLQAVGADDTVIREARDFRDGLRAQMVQRRGFGALAAGGDSQQGAANSHANESPVDDASAERASSNAEATSQPASRQPAEAEPRADTETDQPPAGSFEASAAAVRSPVPVGDLRSDSRDLPEEEESSSVADSNVAPESARSRKTLAAPLVPLAVLLVAGLIAAVLLKSHGRGHQDHGLSRSSPSPQTVAPAPPPAQRKSSVPVSPRVAIRIVTWCYCVIGHEAQIKVKPQVHNLSSRPASIAVGGASRIRLIISAPKTRSWVSPLTRDRYERYGRFLLIPPNPVGAIATVVNEGSYINRSYATHWDGRALSPGAAFSSPTRYARDLVFSVPPNPRVVGIGYWIARHQPYVASSGYFRRWGTRSASGSDF